MALLLIATSLCALDMNFVHISEYAGIHIYSSNSQICWEGNSTVFQFSPDLDSDCIPGHMPHVKIDRRMIYATSTHEAPINVCFGEFNCGGGVFAFGNDFSAVKNQITCKYEIQLTSNIILDSLLIWDMSTHTGVRTDKFHIGSDWPMLCASMEYALQDWGDSMNTSLKFLTLHESLFQKNSASYWLDFCQIDSNAVTVRHKRNDPTLLQGTESPCTVMHVAGASQSYFGSDPPLCLEDLLALVSVVQTPLNNEEDISMKVLYLSSSSALWSVDTHNAESTTVLTDLVAVIISFQNLDFDGKYVVLEARSLFGGVWENLVPCLSHTVDIFTSVALTSSGYEISSSICLGVLRMASATNSEEWDVAVASSMFQWLDWFGHKSMMEELWTRLELVRWLDHFGLHVKSDVCARHHQSQASALWKYMCREKAARQQLGELLLRVPGIAASFHRVMKHLHQLSNDLTTTSMVGYSQRKFDPILYKPVEPLPVSRTHIGVLIFVSHEDVYSATQIVQGWKEGCPHCVLASHFVIFPVTLDDDSDANRKHMSVTRLVLLTVSEWITRMSVRDDVVVVLVGLQALQAFRHPGQIYGAGLIPSVTLGKESLIRLPHPIVFATVDDNSLEKERLTLDTRAFAGQSSKVRQMVRAVLVDPGAAYTEGGAAVVLREYAYTHEALVAVDAKKELFDFSVRTRDPVASSKLPVFIPRSVVSMWPSQKFRSAADVQVVYCCESMICVI